MSDLHVNPASLSKAIDACIHTQNCISFLLSESEDDSLLTSALIHLSEKLEDRLGEVCTMNLVLNPWLLDKHERGDGVSPC